MPTFSQRTTRKYRVIVQELQTYTEYPTADEIKAPRAHDDQGRVPTQRDLEEWVETDEITTAKRTVLASYLRGLANELDPPKPVMRGHDA
jgi:hypothetical protein